MDIIPGDKSAWSLEINFGYNKVTVFENMSNSPVSLMISYKEKVNFV